MIQFITADRCNTVRAVLWRTGNYQYQIEVRRGDIGQTHDISGEYYDVLEQYRRFVESLNQNEVH